MRKHVIGNATLYCGRMEDTIGGLRFDHILTDPPYLYIKTHDFDRPWDEKLLFENARRILPDDGFIALFGRGTSFYRWNTRLAELGFIFKEEIVWKKTHASPTMALLRLHETVSIHTKKNGKIKRCTVPYLEKRAFNIDGIINDIIYIKRAVNNKVDMDKITEFLKSGKIDGYRNYIDQRSITNRSGISGGNRAAGRIRQIIQGMNESSVIEIPALTKNTAHHTEKPVRLAERLLAIISDPGDTIYDPFMGSGSFGIACINTGRKYIGSEMKPEYFKTAVKRIEQAASENCLWQT